MPQPTMADPPSWATFPTELKHAILGHVETEPSPSAVRVQCALVCKEWQSWFEHTNFAHIFINTNRISDFVSFVHNNPRRRSAVQKISICIQLKKPIRLGRYLDEISSNRQRLLHSVIYCLLELLQTWTRPPHSPGLTLDIHTVYYESRIASSFRSQFHPSIPVAPELDYYRCLPRIPIVIALILRGQYYQCLKYGTLSKLLRQSFTHLQTLHIEHLTGESSVSGEDTAEDITPLVAAFPPTLRKWTLFDLAIVTPLFRPGANHLPCEKTSAHLEHITLGSALDAEDFFLSSIPLSNPQSHITWSNLKTLSLISKDFNDGQGIEKILFMAARAVQYMLRLERLDIWRVGPTTVSVNEGCVFYYAVNSSKREAVVFLGSSCRGLGDVWVEVESSWLSTAETMGMRLRSRCGRQVHSCQYGYEAEVGRGCSCPFGWS